MKTSVSAIAERIESKEKTKQIPEAIAAGTSQYGMQTFDQSLFQLLQRGFITKDEALRRATNTDEFKLRLSGVQSSADAAREAMESALETRAPGEGGDSGIEGPDDFTLGDKF